MSTGRLATLLAEEAAKDGMTMVCDTHLKPLQIRSVQYANQTTELERPKADIMSRLRETVGKKLLQDQWMYEPTDYMEELRVANHGRM